MKFTRQVSLTRLLIPVTPVWVAVAPKRRKKTEMRRTFFMTLGLTAILTLAMAGVTQADDYDHSGTNGDLADGNWFNQTATPPGGPNVYGNPGPGDDAYFFGATITASGGSVHLLSGDKLQLSGALTAVNVGILTLSGSGTLDVQAVVTDKNGYTGVTITGGHLTAQNGKDVGSVSAGGTVVDATCTGQCGLYDTGSSLTITGLGSSGQANFYNASTLTASGGLQNFLLNFQSGATGNVSAINGGSATVNGSGSHLTVAGDFSLSSNSLTASSGGVVTVNGNLTQPTGGASVTANGSGSTITVGHDFSLTGGSFQVASGGTIRTQSLTQNRGSDSLSGSNSTLTVDQNFSLLGGFLDISMGGALTVNGQFTLDGGEDVDGDAIGGGGTWQGMGTTIDSNGTMFIGGNGSGGFSLGVSNGATVRTGEVQIGSNPGSVGRVFLSGSGTLWEVQTVGLVVGQGASGTFNISDSGHLLFDNETLFAIGLDSGSNGQMTVDGSGSSVDASQTQTRIGAVAGSVGHLTLTNGAKVTFGQDTSIGRAGNGSLSLASGSQVSVTGNSNTDFGVANDAGSTGGISVQDGSNLNVDANFFIGVAGNGFVGVGTGGMVQTTVVVLGGASGALGTVIVDGAGSTWNTSGDVFIGYTDKGAGKLTVSSGGVFNVVGPERFGIANETGTTGELDVDGGGSRVTASRFIAGVDGAATVKITNGGILETDDAAIASSPVSSSDVLVSDAGSIWNVSAFALYVGGIPLDAAFTQGGPATLTVANGGLVQVSQLIDIGRLGKIVLSGGAVGVGTNANPAVNTLRVAADGLLIGSARVQGQVIVAPGGKILPGNSPGLLTIDGNYTQEAGSTFYAELGGSDPGTGYDQVQVSGTATLAGDLQVRLTNGFTPAVGQTFRILTAGSINGAFTTILAPSQAGISVTSDATGLTVTVTSVTTGAPAISSATTAVARPGLPFSYQIAASNDPTSFGATDLPAGLTVDNNTGLISGTPTTTGAFVVPINANNAAGSGQADLTIISDPSLGSVALPPSNLLNISTRLNVQTGDNVLIGGFIITGTDPKKVIIRGIGPSLANFGVQGFLADPILELHDASTTLETNDNWKTRFDGGSQQAEIEATTVPPTNDLESAIVRTLPANNASYTAVVRGKGNTTGIGVVEAYDLDQTANSKLGNISTRGFVNSGDNVLIGGFITGNGQTKVMVRAIGPSLGTFGVTNPLQDPTLELHDGNGVTIRSNDNWKTREDGTSQQSDIEATTIPPTNDLESALVQTLSPGNYTAVVRGKDDTTGIAVVEVYNLP
jgi:T5SS/PEP-CTERM-associated repeat protein